MEGIAHARVTTSGKKAAENHVRVTGTRSRISKALREKRLGV